MARHDNTNLLTFENIQLRAKDWVTLTSALTESGQKLIDQYSSFLVTQLVLESVQYLYKFHSKVATSQSYMCSPSKSYGRQKVSVDNY